MRSNRSFLGHFRATPESHPVAARISDRHFAQLETTSKPLKTKARRDFRSTVFLAYQTHESNHHFYLRISAFDPVPPPPFSIFEFPFSASTLPFWWLTATPSFRQTSAPKDLGAPASRCPANSSRPPLLRRMIHCEEPHHD